MVKPVFHWCTWSLARIADYLCAHAEWQWWLLCFCTKSSKKLWSLCSRKLTSVTCQVSTYQTQDLCSVFLCANDTFLSDWSWQILLIYQICPVVAKELSDPEKQFPAEPMLFVVSPLNLLIADQINSCKRMAINACKVDMEMTGVLFADKAYAPYKTNHVFPCFSGPWERLFTGVFGELEKPDKVSIAFSRVEIIFKIFTLLASWCNQHFSAEISKFYDKQILTTMLIEAWLPFRLSMFNEKSQSCSWSPLFPICLGRLNKTLLAGYLRACSDTGTTVN